MRRVRQQGQVLVQGRIYCLRALAGEWVQLLRIEDRVPVYYCKTVVREIELGSHRSLRVERWLPS